MRDPGAEQSYDLFFQSAWPRLRGQAYVLTGSHEQAADLTQEALLRTWTHWDRISGYENPEAWTRRVLQNLCIQSWPKSRLRPLAGWPETAITADVPDDHVLLAEAMRRLPGDQARALLLHDGLGFTVSEIARELGAPEGTVKSWLSRSRKIVAENLNRAVGIAHGGDEA